MWKQWITALLGVLTIAVPFLGLSANALAWSLAIIGIVVAVLAVWRGVEEQDMEYRLAHQ
jgi:hypothetical protein